MAAAPRRKTRLHSRLGVLLRLVVVVVVVMARGSGIRQAQPFRHLRIQLALPLNLLQMSAAIAAMKYSDSCSRQPFPATHGALIKQVGYKALRT